MRKHHLIFLGLILVVLLFVAGCTSNETQKKVYTRSNEKYNPSQKNNNDILVNNSDKNNSAKTKIFDLNIDGNRKQKRGNRTKHFNKSISMKFPDGKIPEDFETRMKERFPEDLPDNWEEMKRQKKNNGTNPKRMRARGGRGFVLQEINLTQEQRSIVMDLMRTYRDDTGNLDYHAKLKAVLNEEEYVQYTSLMNITAEVS